MKGTTIHLDEYAGRLAAARIVDGRLDDLLIAPDDDSPAPGAIYRAVVDRTMKGQGGAMVKLPGGTGFLRGAKGLQQGYALNVQVTGYAEPGKAIPVSAEPLFKSRHVIVTPASPATTFRAASRMTTHARRFWRWRMTLQASRARPA